MKKLLLTTSLIIISFFSFSQLNQWAWVAGDNVPQKLPVYGTMGVESPATNPGGRAGTASCVDPSGNLWAFGGGTYTVGATNNLWKYNITTNQWTWLSGDKNTSFPYGVYGTKGVEAAANKPGTRSEAVLWPDASGNIWLFGGQGNARATSGWLNDLWRYNTTNGRWTWMKGDDFADVLGVYGTKGTAAAANKPGSRYHAVGWRNGNDLWLFGGIANSDYRNDLWKYNITSGNWTWISGDNIGNQNGVYGVQGTAATANKPGSRTSVNAGWIDGLGNLWMFGGSGYDETGCNSLLNDLWKFNTGTNQWTWIKGDKICGQIGNYGIKGTVATTNNPGGRNSIISWKDNSGNFWLFGGSGLANSVSQGRLNDLWRYDVPSANWTWISGDSLINQSATYGTLGVPHSLNKPGGRSPEFSWGDTDGNLRLFGGEYLSDQWKFFLNCPTINTPVVTAGGPTTFCSGNSVTLTSSALESNNWYRDGILIPGATAKTYLANVTGSYTVISTPGNCTSESSAAFVVTVNETPATPGITASGSLNFQYGDSVVLSSTSVSGNQWYKNGFLIQGASNQNYIARSTGSYTVNVSSAQCTSFLSAPVNISINATGYETWSKKKSLMDDIPARANGQMVSYNNKLYFFGGTTGSVSATSSFWEYDPQTRVFARMPDLAAPTDIKASAVVNGNLYFQNTLFNFATKTFGTFASPPGTIGDNPYFVISDTIYAVGPTGNCYGYNVNTNSWSVKATCPISTNYAYGFSINGKGYFGGGNNSLAFYEYNPATDVWTAKANLPYVSFSTEGVSGAANGKGYIGTGVIGGVIRNFWYQYDPVANTWTPKANAPYEVKSSTCASVNNDLYLFGGLFPFGARGSFISRYNSITNTWSTDTAFAGGNRASTNAISYNGQIYFTCGDDVAPRADVRAYDIASDNWIRKKDASFVYSQRGQATINNKLYMVGGNLMGGALSYTSQLSEYNPSTDTWAAKANFPRGNSYGLAVFSVNNILYAGLGGGSAPQSAFYKYNPVTNLWAAVASCPISTISATSFAIGDTGYIVSETGSVMYAYNTVTNTWVERTPPPTASFEAAFYSSNVKTFIYNGKAYFIATGDGNNFYTELYEYNAATDTWKDLTSWPVRKHQGHTVVGNGDEAYVGFGEQVKGISKSSSNELWKLNFTPDISDRTGTITHPKYFKVNHQQTVFDSLGNIIAAIRSKAVSNTNVITSRLDVALASRERFGWQGGDRKENAMFINRNLTITGATDSLTTRLFFFNYEIDTLVNRFNRKHSTVYTINDIKAIQFPNGADINPLNNYSDDMLNASMPVIHNTSYGNYANGKYFELNSYRGGEIYLGLVYLKPSPTTLTWTGNGADSAFYNGYNWSPVKIPEFTDTVMFPNATTANLKYIVGFGSLMVGDTVGIYGNPNVREVIINGNLNVENNAFQIKSYGISGRLIVNANGALRTAADIFADNKNTALPASFSIVNNGTIEAPNLRSNYGWLRLENGVFKNGSLHNNGKIEIVNSLLQNSPAFNLSAGSTTIMDSLKLNNVNTDFIFNASAVSLLWPLKINLNVAESKLNLQLPGKPVIDGSILINNNDEDKGLAFSAADTLTTNATITYLNKGGLNIDHALVLNGNLIHNGVDHNSVNSGPVSDVIIEGITQFKAYNLFEPLIISGSGNQILKWPIGLKVPALTINKFFAADTISVYNPLQIHAGQSAIKKGTLVIKFWPGALKTFVITGGAFFIEPAGTLIIEH